MGIGARPDGKKARQMTEQILLMEQSLRQAAEQRPKLEQHLHRMLDEYLVQKIRPDLKKISVDILAEAKRGIRVSALKSAGIENIWQLNARSERRLLEIVGIGKESAKQIRSRCDSLVRGLKAAVPIRLDAERKDPLSAFLVRAIYEYRIKEPVITMASRYYEEYHEKVELCLRTVEPVYNPFSWLFCSAERKEAAIRAYRYLEFLTEGHYADACGQIADLDARIRKATPDKAWMDFEAHAAEYYAILEEIHPQNAKIGGLPEELAEFIRQEEPDFRGLRCNLRRYQYFGVQYILNRKAVLLGDEMGLGKTLEAIAVMVALRNRGATHFMVVCPAGVLVNWCREIERFSDLPYLVLYRRFERELQTWKQKGGVAVTTYETIKRFDLNEQERMTLLVADEAHYVKNPEAIRTRELTELRSNAEYALYMTGTPLENRVEEMCRLIEVLQPDIAEKLRRNTCLSSAPEFRELIAPVYLRRTREDVLQELPEITRREDWNELTEEEAAIYYEDTMQRNFMQMRQLSWKLPDVTRSSKAAGLEHILALAGEEGRKVLVFSYFRNTLEQVKKLCPRQCLGVINGSVSPAKRQELVDAFEKAEPGTFLAAQVQSGGTGLNIQCASVVVFCEPQLKPSLESQAIARACRMGQVRGVQVYHLLCVDTVDERIRELLQNKQLVFDSFAEDSVSGEASLEQAETGALVEAEVQKLLEKMEKQRALLAEEDKLRKLQKDQKMPSQEPVREEVPADALTLECRRKVREYEEQLRREMKEGNGELRLTLSEREHLLGSAEKDHDAAAEAGAACCGSCGRERISDGSFCPFCGKEYND